MTKKVSWLKADEARYDNLLKIMLDNVVSSSISMKDLQKKLQFMLTIMDGDDDTDDDSSLNIEYKLKADGSVW